MIDLRASVDAWCQSYVTAFSSYEAQAIGAHWSFPAVLISGDRNISFATKDQFNQNTEALLGFYRKVGVAGARRNLFDVFSMGQGTVAISAADEMLDASGQVITSWQSSYVLRQHGSSWLAVMANANGELAAWSARGTPLGR
ncbi:MAG: hypothetical protein AAGG45_00110 [Pseudomonadota bacterium]